MLKNFALAFKTKTIEFFAEDEEELLEDEEEQEEVITGQRVVVLKPDPIPDPNPKPETLIPSVFAAVSSFRAAYLHLQAAHAPFDSSAVLAADRTAVSHLHRLSLLKHQFHNPNPNPNPNLTFLEAQVQENQTLLRTFETVFNRLQSDIDCKDAAAAELKQRLNDSEAENSRLAKRISSSRPIPEEKLQSLLSVGVFDSMLKDCCRSVHSFTRAVIGSMRKSGLDLDSVANAIYPNAEYAKSGHCRYAILSYVCLGMFGGFDSDGFCCGESGSGLDSLRQFIEHLARDPLEVISKQSNCGFGKFCREKYEEVIGKGIESSFFGNLDRLLEPSNPLYALFVDMASSVYALHKLARAYDPVVEVFQVGERTEFSMVYMEDVVRRFPLMGSDCGMTLRPKVVFTVVPGFRVGKTVIQSRVYLDGVKEIL